MPAAPASRNDPCPCGSGKKYKKCCLGKKPTGAEAAAGGGATAGSGGTRGDGAPDADQWLMRAQSLHQDNQLGQAARAYAKVLETRADDAEAIFGLGQIVIARGEIQKGAELVERAIAADPKVAAFHVCLADARLQLGLADEALQSAEQAVALAPAEAAGHCAVANCHDRTNRREEGLAAARRAVERAPRDANAVVLLARLERQTGDQDAAGRRLDAVLADGTTPTYFRQRALFEKGMLLDQAGRYDEAYAAFAECGDETSRDPQARPIDRDIWFRRIDEYRAGLTPELLGRWKPEDVAGDRPAPTFLIGFPRSGTTMTEQIMAAHPRVRTSDEREFIRAAKDEMMRMTGVEEEAGGSGGGGGGGVPEALGRLDAAQIGRLRSFYWQRVEAAHGPVGDHVFVDKLPLNIVDVGLINVLFPDARVIVALRDPRDVCLSCFMQWFGLNTSMINFLSLDRTVAFFARVMGLWLHLREHLTLRYEEIRYEDTVTDLETQARLILDVLGVAWDPAVLRFHERAKNRLISTPSFTAVTEAVHTRAVARWKNYAGHFEPHQAALAPFVEAFGYEA